MSKKNDDFFKEKKPWSEVKDELLGCYLKPYIQKVLITRKPIVYVDCFAGKGKFEDGKPGSPIIALDTIRNCMSLTQVEDCSIAPYFIDLNYAEDLKSNITTYKVPDKNIVSGKYEEEIKGILTGKDGSNLFLYIDPYGIKALNHKFFEEFASSKKYNSVELLINLNSFGFIREGCRVLGVNFGDETLLEDLVEYETTKLDQNEKSVDLLNEIAGGDYWQNIIHAKNRGEIDTKEAEKLFADQYCGRLKQNYKYVLNMPLRIKKGQAPKYRMVHATNHIVGCLLMVDNIFNRWQFMKDIQTCGQMSLFSEDVDNNIIDDVELEEQVKEHIQKYQKLERLNDILADFFMQNGPICSTSKVKEIYKALEKLGKIVVVRDPATTDKTGNPSRFFADEKGKTTKLRWKS
nr:three-Cys-motif partner protein TcmP [uncultured Clostridium sp.]